MLLFKIKGLLLSDERSPSCENNTYVAAGCLFFAGEDLKQLVIKSAVKYNLPSPPSMIHPPPRGTGGSQ